MYEALALLELSIWLGLPAWIANATPVIFGGGRPIDGGRFMRDGHRILGDGKTIRGFIVGVFFGILTVGALAGRLGGPLAAVAAVGAAALSPNLVAHSTLATLDLPVTAFTAGAMLLAWRWVRQPSPGKLLLVRWPSGPGVRVDSGIETGLEVSTYYDPILAKIITWGEDREMARVRMIHALEEMVILGVVTPDGFVPGRSHYRAQRW